MISHKHKFIFVAIPKTGTSSVISVLGKIDPEACESKTSPEKHLTLTEYQSMYPDTRDYYSFTIVRNPWDRLVSQYFFTRRVTQNFKYGFFKDNKVEDTSFQSFIHNIVGKGIPYTKHSYNTKTSKQSWDSNSDQLNYINMNITRICKFESLQFEFNIICDEINIPRHQLPHNNPTKHKHYTEYYDDETKQIVADLFAKDIEYFGYQFI